MGEESESPVFVLGAGRSGTNLLGHLFSAEAGRFLNTFEHRYVWNYGQRDRRFDLRSAAEATAPVRDYIRRHFARLKPGPEVRVIDKTPSNAFRIPFMLEIFPDAKIVHIVRDGRDNILSRVRQWESRGDPQGAGEQARHRPPEGLKGRFDFVAQRLRHIRMLSTVGGLPKDRWPVFLGDNVAPFVGHLVTGRPRRYGERVAGLREVRAAYGLDAAAAVQWRECVMAAVTEGRRLGPAHYHEIRYEDFLERPEENWKAILDFVGVAPAEGGNAFLSDRVQRGNRRKWDSPENRDRIAALEPHLRPTLEYLGYSW